MRFGRIGDAAMENHLWQLRARAAGLTQRVLGRLLNHHEQTVSSQLRGHWQSGVPGHVISAILAWEIMSPEQRETWLAAAEKELGQHKRSGNRSDAPDTDIRVLQRRIRELEKRLEAKELK